MKARVVTLVALAAAVTLTSFAAAGPDAAKQRMQIDLKVHPRKTFALATLQSGALKRDSGTLGACTGETNGKILRNGQELFLNACRAAEFTGKRGTLVLRTQIAWAEAGGRYNIATGTWKVVRGTGQYVGIAGSGRIAQVGTPTMSVARYQGFLTSP